MFLREDPLPDLLISVNVKHVAVLSQLELRCAPFSVDGHAETKIHAILNRHLDKLLHFHRILLFLSLGWCLALGALCLFSFGLFACFALHNFVLCLAALDGLDHAGEHLDLFFSHA